MHRSGRSRGSGPPEEPSVGIKALRAAFAVATTAKLDLGALAARHGIESADLEDPDHRYSHAAWTALWEDIEQCSGDPGIGLHAAAALPIGHWDVVDFLVSFSETIGEGFHRLERYFPLISTAVDHVVRIGPDEARIVREHRPEATRSRPASELAVASIVLRFRAQACSEWAPKHVAFAHGPSVPAAEYERLFGCEVTFGNEADAIVVDRKVLDIRMRRPESELCSVLERHAKTMLAQMPKLRPSVVDRVKQSLAGDLPSGTPPVSKTAKRLGMSTRTLQRRLTEAGVAYSDLVEQTREALARRYLADPQLGFGEVAILVGFADVSAFYKAFRRWTGQTPGRFRMRSQ